MAVSAALRTNRPSKKVVETNFTKLDLKLLGTLLENIKHYQPTRFMGVTRIFEKIEEGVRNQEAEMTGVKKMVFTWAQKQALHHHMSEMGGKEHTSLGYNVAKKLVFNKVHRNQTSSIKEF